MAEPRYQPYPLYKGATRAATFGGVPLMPLLVMFIVVASLAMGFSLWMWLFVPGLWFVMAQITRHDDKAFRIWWLWLDTKFRNRNKRFWGASSYSPSNNRKKR